ncbi:UNVERIFIED_CONTAM: hypothetical protein FKN15_076147 [Acipenser sinensis]
MQPVTQQQPPRKSKAGDSRYQQFLKSVAPFHPTDPGLNQDSSLQRFPNAGGSTGAGADLFGSGPPPLHPSLALHQPGLAVGGAQHQLSGQNNMDPRNLHQQFFSCEVCGKSFGYANSLARHRAAQHARGKSVGPASDGTGGSAISESQAATDALLQLSPPNPTGIPFFVPSNLREPVPNLVGGDPLIRTPSGLSYAPTPNPDPSLLSYDPGFTSQGKKKALRVKKRKAKRKRRRNGRSHTDKRFPCTVCARASFPRLSQLLVHRSSRHSEPQDGRLERGAAGRRWGCQGCRRGFSSFLRLLGHRGWHVKQGNHGCGKCQRKFWNRRLLERHREMCMGKQRRRLRGRGNGEDRRGERERNQT